MDPGTFVPWAGLSDPVAATTHMAGALASIAGGIQLWARTPGDRWRRFTVVVFSASMLALYVASAAYHSVAPSPLKAALRHWDHAAIYVLIAGTFTPIVGNLVRGRFRAFVLATVWSLALAGVALKLLFFGAPWLPEWLDVALYLGLGWFGVVPFVRIFQDHGACRPVFLIGTPALVYSIGAVCELVGWPVFVEHVFGYHEVFHLCVLLASALFYAFILEYVARKPGAPRPASEPPAAEPPPAPASPMAGPSP